MGSLARGPRATLPCRLLALFVVLAVGGCSPSRPEPHSPAVASSPPAPPGSPAVPSGATGEPAGSGCGISLQSLIDAAAPGSIVRVPACVYRETATVDKPLTLLATPGAEIRGSDVWTNWTPSGGTWASSRSVPRFDAHGVCRAGTRRCLWPEQVFVDGVALLQRRTGATPEPGQFALDRERRVVLPLDPAGHTVEVTMRARWLITAADGITIDGFRMRHAANDSQSGAITDEGHTVTIQDSVLSDAHGAVVSLSGAGGLLRNDISRGGQLGVHRGGRLVQGNRIHDNHTEDFDVGWEAGGMKAVAPDITVDGNEVYNNNGSGIWFDSVSLRSTDIVISNNNVHHNHGSGIFFEIGDRARIHANKVWENGWGDPNWGWGAGIRVSTSRNVDVYDNVVAWNADGISVISQNRPDNPGPITGNRVRDNIIVGMGSQGHTYYLAWLEDWAGAMYQEASENRGANNRYWTDGPEARFAWDGDRTTLADFNATPGEEGGRYLSTAERDALLTAAGIPLSPESR